MWSKCFEISLDYPRGLPTITKGFHNGRKTRKRGGQVVKGEEMGFISTSQEAQRERDRFSFGASGKD